MSGRIIELGTDGRSLHLERGFLSVREGGTTVGRVAIDDVDAVIATTPGIMWSNRSLAALAERGVPVVILGPNYQPASVLLPLAGYHDQGRRMRAQAGATVPMRKRVWAELVRAKITAQIDLLEYLGVDAIRLRTLRASVRSGDPDNREAAAAQAYWPLLMGSAFRRDRSAADANALLNYGYAILRSGAARAIVAAGLHPALSVHHVSDGDPFALADDVMEPFRPAVDLVVLDLMQDHSLTLTPDTKAQLAGILLADIVTPQGRTPIGHCMVRTCQSLAGIFLKQRQDLDLPPSCLPVRDELPL